MRRYVALILMVAGAVAAIPVRHAHTDLAAQNDALSMPVLFDDATYECTLAGTWAGTVTFRTATSGYDATAANWVTVVTPDRTASATTTSNGSFTFRVAGLAGLQVKFTTRSSGTVNVDCQPGSGTAPTIPSTTSTAQDVNLTKVGGTTISATNPVPVAQKGSTTATAPTAGNLTAATATKVFTAAAGTCSVTVANTDATNAMNCGETNVVSATVGIPVAKGTTFTFPLGYGGDVYCYPAASTPAYSVQSTACAP